MTNHIKFLDEHFKIHNKLAHLAFHLKTSVLAIKIANSTPPHKSLMRTIKRYYEALVIRKST
jgi:hypothetical protein